MKERLADIYAQALITDSEKAFCKQLEWITSIFHRHPELQDILSMPEISLEEKKKNLEEIFKEKVDSQLFHLLLILASNGRLSLLDGIFQEFRRRVNEADQVVSGKIISAFSLEDEKIHSIESQFSRLLLKQVRFSIEVDPLLIGGIIVIIGDKIYDGSIRSQLMKLKEHILNS